MTDVLKSKKPEPKTSEPPETHAQTEPVEQKLKPSPQHHTTENYGKSGGKAPRRADR